MSVLLKRAIFLLFAACLAFAGCAKVGFEVDKSFKACHGSGVSCVTISDGVERFDYDVQVGAGMVDILIIDDNSGSMSGEQRNMAQRFPTFISSLGNLDYRIAITTTDVSASPNNGPRSINGNGALQDGKFIPFASGVSYLTRSNSNAETLFANTIQRPETLTCEQNGYNEAYCPSGDERGIYAASLAVERKEAGFFRNQAHFALVVLSDEDERSTGGSAQNRSLEEKDMPQNLINAVKANLGLQKTFSTHALIIRSSDSSCYNQQWFGFNLHGSYGTVYEQLVGLTGGHLGSICASDYGAELGSIGYNITDQVNSKGLVCPPIDNRVDVVLSPQPAGVTVNYDAATNTVRFSQTLPPNTNIHLTYDCVKAN